MLFQVGLAILRINGEELLDATDDGTFISVLKSYFARLGESAHPTSENPKHRAITNFQALMVVAFKEFEGITQATISEQRTKHKDAVMQNIESFAKRTSIRNLGPESKKLSANDLGFLYDRFYSILYERQQRAQMIQAESDRRAKLARQRASQLVTGVPGNVPEMGRVALGASTSTMDYDAFREFLAGVSRWALTDSPSSPVKDGNSSSGYFGSSSRGKPPNLSPWGTGPEPADHDFMRRLFGKWDVDSNGSLSLQNVVVGLAPIKGGRDIMANIAYFFELYDDDKDGRVDREGILRMSEALLFLARRGLEGADLVQHHADTGPDGIPLSKDEQFLSAVSSFIRRCFEYADPDHPSRQGEKDMSEAATAVADIKLSEDSEEEDLLVDEKELKSTDEDPLAQEPAPETTKIAENSLPARPSINTSGQTANPRAVAANAALDPSSPVHITLPTFRMLVLADEALESFFDSGFANSFHLADAPLPSTALTSPSFLSVSSSTPGNERQNLRIPTLSPGGPGAGVVPPGKGLRGMLDNIVSDGMRVAAEVKRRMDEAQKELDRGATTRGTEDDDDEEGEEGVGDLLGGVEADAGAAGTGDAAKKSLESQGGKDKVPASLRNEGMAAEPVKSSGASVKSTDTGVVKDTMFER